MFLTLSYCGLVDAKIRASDKNLPVHSPDSVNFHTNAKYLGPTLSNHPDSSMRNT